MIRPGRWLLAGTLAALLALGGFWLWFERWLDQPGPLAQQTLVLLPRGSGAEGIADRLAETGAIASRPLWLLGVWRLDAAGALKAGEYALAAGISPRGVIEQLRAGRVHQRRLTIPEGLSSAAIWKLVAGAEAMSGALPGQPAPEGSLLPETYQYLHGDGRGDLIERMRRAQEELVAQLWAQRQPGLPYATPQEAVILAAIVEAETPKPEERPRVAAVFVNRLKRGMKLQSDPTVIYGLTRGEAELGRALTRADLAQATPWNTYAIDGLPPTPINHPGRASLMAALNPLATRELYFVADGRGGHAFAETYEQHLRNVAAYRASQGR